jgi:CubicO group peptidase (beta-lactamase class C family)
VLLDLLAAGAVTLHDPVAQFFPEWTGADRESVTLQDLLEHASGLSARLVDKPPEGRREFEHDICTMPLAYPPRTRSIYSDLGFILLGFLAADRGQASLSEQFERILVRIHAVLAFVPDEWLAFGVPSDFAARVAPTLPLEDDVRRGRVLAGAVHDNYAAALNGVAGHAGLFGTAGGVGRFARVLLRSARGDASIPPPLSSALLARAIRKSAVPGSSRGLGWDTMLPTSSCGTELSPAAFGHVGFTGTSLWVDPILDRYFVLLTNRAYQGGSSEEMQTVRRTFHDAAATL